MITDKFDWTVYTVHEQVPELYLVLSLKHFERINERPFSVIHFERDRYTKDVVSFWIM